MIRSARFAQLFGLLVRSCSDVKDTPAAPVRKDKDSKRRRKRLSIGSYEAISITLKY